MPVATDSYDSSTAWMQRDSYGYGRNPPNPNWPNGAKVAVNFVLNYEEGGERTIEDGDAGPETALHEFKGLEQPAGRRDPTVESQFDYGSRVGIWRILDLMESNNIRNREVAKAACENGHEVASHCFKWQPHADMSPEEEEQWIRKAVESFKKTTGKVPVGWYYGRPSAQSPALVEKVYRELGHEFLYWADNYADDLPHWTVRPGDDPEKALLIMPYSLDNNDFKLWHSQYGSTKLWAEHCVDSVKTIRDEAIAGKRHGYITIALHTRWVGRPGRFAALKKMVEEIVGLGDVWFATREDIARHFAQQYPYGSLPKSKSTA
ncbi:hypothetical protein Rhopal_005483-T1 [Rhodotorula paludigena]|uniref:NodB homology domain-containing protein n=1 Tax=Rhodotorula paludigena TaxID=86838 RepID=A0AAV5GV36_9BASI|nr:hypothetical protein Rhopal_005483-T1 [Rhodotorula paludigena]